MLIDHVGVVLTNIYPDYVHVFIIFRAVGRLAWPIFAYLLAEGFRHTKAHDKFMMRLLAFAFISQIPYALAFGNTISFTANTNIFYTLFLGGMAIFLYERYKARYNGQTMAVIAAILPTATMAEVLTADYGGLGVCFIFVVYLVKPKIARLIAVGAFALSQFIPLVMAYSLGIVFPTEYLLMIPFALATIPLIALHNGKRGYNWALSKWLFYWFYPAHLAILAVITML